MSRGRSDANHYGLWIETPNPCQEMEPLMSMISNFRRPVKSTRTAPVVATPFALGLEGDAVLAASWSTKGIHFDLVEHQDNPGRYAFMLYASRDGKLIDAKGCDTVGEAKAYAYCLSTPMPVEPEPVAVVEAPVKAVVARKSTWKPYTAADVLWEAMNSPLNATFFDIMPICGGSPEPEPELSLIGTWVMPGEDSDLSFSDRCDLLPEPVVAGFDSDANGQFGYTRDSE